MSRFLRRSHMYLALFLAPWILIYALSTMAMNHRHLFHKEGEPPRFEKVRELTYEGSFAGSAPKQVAQQLLLSLDLDGAHQASAQPGGRIVIQRFDPVTPYRITLETQSNRVTVERQVFQSAAFLERMHRRRGFQHDYMVDDIWALSVDIVIAAILFWAFSGLWMWWELKVTRAFGALCLAGGIAVFACYLASI